MSKINYAKGRGVVDDLMFRIHDYRLACFLARECAMFAEGGVKEAVWEERMKISASLAVSKEAAQR